MTRKSAFTLNELLVVIAIIVLMIGLALPAFSVLTGNKSAEGATNQVSAFLGQARMEAIGVQKMRGVMFFIDLETDRINMAMVQESFTATIGPSLECTFLDLVPDRDFISLPPGIGLQTIDDTVFNNGNANDKYLGFNSPDTLASLSSKGVLYGGVILFDGYGKLSSAPYGFRCTTDADNVGPPANAPIGTTGVWSAMGSLFATGSVIRAGEAATVARNFSNTAALYAGSYTNKGQYGVILYDRDAYTSSVTGVDSTGRDEDWQITNANALPTSDNEYLREAWLAENATHLLVNRYNGTLVKGD
jgi:type II secretory pathway pseudopilin PulG